MDRPEGEEVVIQVEELEDRQDHQVLALRVKGLPPKPVQEVRCRFGN